MEEKGAAPACFRYVDFPLLFGPVTTRKFMNGLQVRKRQYAQGTSRWGQDRKKEQRHCVCVGGGGVLAQRSKCE